MELASVLNTKRIQMVISSGLKRARQTAEEFEKITGLKAHVVEGLNEIDPGDIYSATEQEKLSITSHNHGLDFTKHGGENPDLFSKRVVKAFAEVVSTAETKGSDTIAAFIHGGTIGAILDHLAGLPFDYKRRSRMPNGAYALIETDHDPVRISDEWLSSHISDPT